MICYKIVQGLNFGCTKKDKIKKGISEKSLKIGSLWVEIFLNYPVTYFPFYTWKWCKLSNKWSVKSIWFNFLS